MTWVRDTTRSYRDNIMEYYLDLFVNLRAGTDEYSVTWNSVERKPLPASPSNFPSTAISIMDHRESKKELIGMYQCHLIIHTEFAIRLNVGDNPSVELNRLMLDVQRAMRKDNTAGGLIINVVETNSELDIEGPGDRLVGGIISWEVHYRHALDDPRKHRGE
jgi:hypothetical protein